MRHLTAALLIVVIGTPALADGGSALAKPQVEPGEVHVQPTELPRPKGLILTLETYPRTSGSTSAEPMGVWVASRLLGRRCTWPGKSWNQRRLMPLKAGAKMDLPFHEGLGTELYSKIQHHGTHGSYKRVITGAADLIYECRMPSQDEQRMMEEKGVKLDIRPIALDAFVFLRHKYNPVKELTMKQIWGIYTRGAGDKGKIANWKKVGGPDAEIHPFARNRNSGSQETMQSLVMKKRSMVSGRSMTGSSMSGPYNMMHKDKNGIGFTFFYYQRHMAPLGREGFRQTGQAARRQRKEGAQAPLVEMFAINGVAPTRDTIADRTYPLVTDVYIVTRKSLKADHPAAKLRDWLLSAEGQQIVGETGYVPISAAKQ